MHYMALFGMAIMVMTVVWAGVLTKITFWEAIRAGDKIALTFFLLIWFLILSASGIVIVVFIS